MHVRKSESILVLLMHVCLTAAVHIVGLTAAAAASDTGVPDALQLTSGRHDATHWAVAHFEVAAFVDLINAGSVHQLRTCVCAQGMAQRPERFAALCAEVASILDKSPSFTRQIISLDGPAKAFPVPCDKAVELLITQRLQSQFPEMRQALSLLGPKNREGNSKMTEGVVSLANAPMLISPNPQHPVLQSLFDLTLRPAKLQPLNAQELDDALETYRSESTTLCSRYFGSANGQQRLAQAKRWFAGDLTTVSVCSFIVNGTTPDGADNLTAQVLLSPLTDPYYRWAGAHRENEFTEKQRQDDAKLGFREKHRRDYTNLANRNPLLLLVSSANPSLEEVATALVQLDANAQSRFDRSQARAKRLRSLTKDQAGALDTFARDELYEYSGYSDEPYTSLVLKREGWSEPEIESASSAVKADYSHQMAWRFAKQATELAAIFASCQFVARRIPVPVLSLFSRSACVVGLGVPLNSYFLYEAMQSYDEAFRDFFSAVEPHRVMESIASLNGKRVGMELAAVLFPLTLSPRAHVQIANELKNALDGWIARIAVRFPKQFGASKPTSSP